MDSDCGLKNVYVCINQTYQLIDVDKVVADLKENLVETDIKVWKGLINYKSKNEEITDYLIIGDEEQADIGLGEQYRGKAHFVTYEAEDIEESYLRLVWARKNHRPFVVAESERLLIREMTMDDMELLYELYASLANCPFVEPLYEREDEEDFSRKYIENMYAFYGYGLWLVFLKEQSREGKLVARVGIENRMIDGRMEQELGYLVNKKFWKQKIAWESCQMTLDYAEKVIGLKHIFCCIHRDNKKSIALAQKLGFVPYAMDVDHMNLYRKCYNSNT